MNWNICFSISVLIAAASIAAAIVSAKAKRKHGKLLTPFNILFGGMFAAAFVLALPIFGESAEKSITGVLKTIFLSLHGTFQTFTLDSDRALILESINTDIAWIYSAYMSLLFVAAPILTFGAVVSFFKNISGRPSVQIRIL